MVRLLVVGAGAVGAYYAALIAKSRPASVVLLTRGESLEAIRRDGVKLRGGGKEESVRVEVAGDASAVSRPDYVMLTPKMYDLEGALLQVRELVGACRGVFGLENGIEKEEIISRYSADPLCATTYVPCERLAPGVVSYAGGQRRVYLGESDDSRSARVTEVSGLLNECGIECIVPDDIVLELWSKFVLVCSVLGVCAAARCNSGQATSYEPTRRLMVAALKEGFEVAAAHGHEISPERKEEHLAKLRPRRDRERPSMMVDAVRGRRTEVEYINGALLRKASEKGVRVPVNEMLYALVSSPKDLLDD